MKDEQVEEIIEQLEDEMLVFEMVVDDTPDQHATMLYRKADKLYESLKKNLKAFQRVCQKRDAFANP